MSTHTMAIHPKRVVQLLGIFIGAITVIAFWFGTFYWFFGDDEYLDDSVYPSESYDDFSLESEECNAVGINLHGELWTYATEYDPETLTPLYGASSEDIVAIIESAEEEKEIKAILIDIDSTGGGPVAAEEIATALKQAKKSTVALIRENGLSAAYWAATGADIIFASQLSNIGSIGVTASYVDAAKYNEEEGFTYNVLRTAPFKDYWNQEKPLTAQEKALIMRDLQIVHGAFIKAVAQNRGLETTQVERLADGSSILGEAALKSGLIDRIGSYAEVRQYIEEQIGEKPEICW
jgi:signal peptide peptidase SppA